MRHRSPYQGMRVNTPARISSAARSAATTAQPSIDKSQLFLEFRDTALVLIVLSFTLASSQRSGPAARYGCPRSKTLG